MATVPAERPVVVFVPSSGKVGPVAILELEGYHCRWPIGDPLGEEFRHCGQVRSGWGPGSVHETAKPYCDDHEQVAHLPLRQNRLPRPHNERRFR